MGLGDGEATAVRIVDEAHRDLVDANDGPSEVSPSRSIHFGEFVGVEVELQWDVSTRLQDAVDPRLVNRV